MIFIVTQTKRYCDIDWLRVLGMLTIFIPAIEKVRLLSLILSVLTVVIADILLVEMGYSFANPLNIFVRAVNVWALLLTFLGFASRYLNFSNSFLQYANEAVLPFYILHQTVIVVIGYFVRNWQWAILPKYLFLASTSFIVIIYLYEFVIKRVKLFRILSGMKV